MSVKREKKQEQVWLRTVTEVTKGGALAVVGAVAFLALTAGLKVMGVLAWGAEGGYVIAACVLGTLIGGLFAAGRCGCGKLLVGVGVGVAALLIQLTVGALCLGGVGGAGEMRGACLGCFLGGMLAGVLSAVGKGKSRSKR